MPAGDVETFFDDGRDMWANRVEGRTDVLSEHRTKTEAVRKGREYALWLSKLADPLRRRTVEHIIRDEDGKIRQRNTYPRSEDPPGTGG
jgi:hypothetical protein